MSFNIYLITNLINGKKYVGQTVNVKRRWNDHNKPHNLKSNRPLTNALKKYGKDNFKMEVLEIWHTQEEANEAEIFLIDYHHSHVSTGKGYNVELGGKVAPCSPETRAKISLSKIGKSNRTKGIKCSQERKDNISKANKGKAKPLGFKNSGMFIKGKLLGIDNANLKGKTWKLVNGKRVWFEKEIQ